MSATRSPIAISRRGWWSISRAAMHFGTQHSTKSQIAARRRGHRRIPDRPQPEPIGCGVGRRATSADLATTPRIATTCERFCARSPSHPTPKDWAEAIFPRRCDRVAALSKRRGFVCVISDFAGDDWAGPMSLLSMRHDLLAIGITDPREFDVPPIGFVTFSDPSTGSTREVMVTGDVQRRFARARRGRTNEPGADRAGVGQRLAGAVDGRRLVVGDRRARASAPAAPGDGPPMSWDFLAPQRLWLLLVVAALVVAYVLAQRRRATNTVRFTQIEMLEQIAPRRPGWRRHAIAGIQLAALTVGVIAAAQPVVRSTTRPQAAGKIMLLFDVSLSMQADDVAPNRLDAAKKAGEDFIDNVDADVEVGLISFSGTVGTDVEPTTDRVQLTKAIEALELGEGTAIGDAIAAGTRQLQRGEPTENSPGTLVVLSDGETTRGRATADGAQVAKDANVPVYTIAFGTANGEITNPSTGEVDAVPVKLDELQNAADITGGTAYVAPSAADLAKAYDDIRANLQRTEGSPEPIIRELTWRYVLVAVFLLMLAWGLGLWWLRGPL